MKLINKILLCYLIFIFHPSIIYCQKQEANADTVLSMNIGTYPLLRQSEYEMQSSYDRSGGNDDGFSGKYSVIRKENNKAVISEMQGAGTITRIWFPSDPDYPEGPMGLRNKRIYIYLDSNPTPAIDMPAIQMFNNSDKRFPYPLCGMGLGGCWSYVPISFNNGAKIMVEGDSARFFHVEYNKYYGRSPLKTFSAALAATVAGYGQLTDAMWHPGDAGRLAIEGGLTRTASYSLSPGMNELPFIKGPAVLRGITVKASPADLDAFLNGNLSITWDDANIPAVNVPLSLFFIREKEGLAGKSLMAGTLHGGGGVYNFFPMPYHDSARVQINVSRNCIVNITTVFEKPAAWSDRAYLHINHVRNYPTTPGKTHVFLDVAGRGHYAGTYLRASGKSLHDSSGFKSLYWTGCLEGDEAIEVDGKMVEHGTGTEDYFNAGWNGLQLRLDRAGTYPFHGYTLFDAGRDESRTAAYRWRMPEEVVPFKKHFRATIEVGPQDDIAGNYESISYYYLTEAGSAPTPQWRPVYHFTPEKNWTNDPNGLIYINNTYHLFHQYNPFENNWGHMSWGHATSKDLIHWQYLPVAMKEILGKDTVSIFSGSAVWDKNNSSGFCKSGGCLVAVFTGNYSLRKEAQYISYSNDTGRTFTYYDKNPVIDLNKKDFRDPNVFWYEATRNWIMTVALPAESKLRFYASKDLKSWELLSEFGPAGISKFGYECPFMIPLSVDCNPANKKWLLAVSSGGNGAFMQYFIGDFDGKTFRNDHPADTVSVIDYGDALYAGIPWNGLPGDTKTFIGWMVPGSQETYPWKGQMSIARDLSFRTTTQGIKLFQTPAAVVEHSMDKFTHNKAITLNPVQLLNNQIALDTRGASKNNAYRITAELVPGTAKIIGLKIAQKKSDDKNPVEETVIGYDSETSQLYIDRSSYTRQNIRNDKLRQGFLIHPVSGKIKLNILLDRSSLEVFANDGEKVLSTLIFPSEGANGISAFAEQGNGSITNFKIRDLFILHPDPVKTK